jgi:protein arginine N-methyltransferase 1
MYSVLNFGQMAADGVRMDAYARAIERAVKPGSVVLDIGAGTGIFSLLAARAGARRVHAVDPNPAIWVLAEIARENRLDHRITIHHTTSYELDLAEKADVVVSDLRGSVPPFEEHFAVLRDARRRLLAPGGVLIPERDELLVGVFEDEAIARWWTKASSAFERRGWSAEAARRSVLNTPDMDDRQLRSSSMLTEGGRWGHIVYGTDDIALEGEVSLTVRRGGTAHGLAVWFSATILGELGFSTEPGSVVVYQRLVLPLLEPVELEPTDRVRVVLRADESGARWAWETEVTTGKDGAPKARQRQASFFGMPTSPSALVRSSSSFTPAVSARGERVKLALALMDGKRSIREIADQVYASMGTTSVPSAQILEEVRSLAASYGR